MAHRIQLTTDGLNFYLPAVGGAFGTDVDYAMLVKIYGEPERLKPATAPRNAWERRKRLSPREPEMEHVSTTFRAPQSDDPHGKPRFTR